MGRLIDADELLAQIRQVDFLKMPNSTKLSACEIMEIVNNQPTAYNVDNVVKELACNSRFIDDINEHNIKCISCVIGQKTAIDVVKRGGVE